MQSKGQTGIHTLTIHVPNRRIQTITLEHGRKYTLGRDESSDIVPEQSCVSRRHAILTAGEPPTIVDVGSRNGTSVDGQLLAPQTACPLRVGSVVLMGTVALFVSRELCSSGVRPVNPVRTGANDEESTRVHGVRPVVRDRGMLQLYAFAQQIAASSATVLITGETGVGKELMAQAIHRNSPRASRELVALNCAAIPESLIESELFGYQRGAFSGAVGAKPGLFETAHRSTFLLDEVGELPLSAQAKLLRVLETGDVSRLGAVRPTRVDVRVVAATNRHLSAEVARGAFRADLYYRLNGLTISIPPLRERPDDIEELARHFAASCAPGVGLEFSKAAVAALRAHTWPGNVRELKSVVQRAVLVNMGGLVEPIDLMFDVAPSTGSGSVLEQGDGEPATADTTDQRIFSPDDISATAVRAELERHEHRRIKETLARTAGNQTEAASLLGISRRTLMNRMDRLGISRPRKGARRSGDD